MAAAAIAGASLGRLDGASGYLGPVVPALAAPWLRPSRGNRLARHAAGTAEPFNPGAYVRLVTYNLLSPTMCSPARFPYCDPADLGEAVRFHRVWRKIEEVLRTEDFSEAVIVLCFQEVSESWASRLHVRFQQRGWHFVYAQTPTTEYSPIGVAMAWNNNKVGLQFMSIRRPVALLQWEKLVAWMLKAHSTEVIEWSDVERPWALAAGRQNRLLLAKLQDKRFGVKGNFVVATYHMPCFYRNPEERQAKSIHALLVRDMVVDFAGGCSFALAADLNTKPGDSELRLLTDARMDQHDEAWPRPTDMLDLCGWLPSSPSGRLRSAYQEALGREPEYTNYAWVEDEPKPFQDTIDYIMVSEGVRVTSVRPQKRIDTSELVYPSEAEPSDHLLLSADLLFPG